MNTLKTVYRNVSIVRKPVIFARRAKIAVGYFNVPLLNMIKWLFQSREITNFTYNLTEINTRYLASFISDITKKTYEEIIGYITELELDHNLEKHLQLMTQQSPEKEVADLDIRFGRRIGWYAFVRAVKPKIVIETGVDKGLGSCVLTAALMKNKEEGKPGYYYGTDINPRAGYLLSGEYKKYGEILFGDSIASLRNITGPIDIFINDSDHSALYEEREYEVIRDKLSQEAIVLGDNAHVTDKLLNFAQATGKHFLFFQEKPRNHWYPGGGIGVAFQRSSLLIHKESHLAA